MTKISSGVYQLPNGMWGFRYAYMLNGKQKDLKRTKDEFGNPFKTERAAASRALAAALLLHDQAIFNSLCRKLLQNPR